MDAHTPNAARKLVAATRVAARGGAAHKVRSIFGCHGLASARLVRILLLDPFLLVLASANFEQAKNNRQTTIQHQVSLNTSKLKRANRLQDSEKKKALASPWHSAAFNTCLSIFLFCLLSLTGCKTFSQRGPVPEAVASCRQLSQQGIDHIHQGKWEQAEILLAQAVTACDTNAEARQQYAETLWHRGARKEAVAQMETALKLSPDDATLHCRLGEMHLAMRDFPKAEFHVVQAMQHDGKLAAAWSLRGRIHRAAGRPVPALSDMQRALCYAPDDASILLTIAELQREAAQPQRALVTLLALADLYPPGEEPQEVLYLTGLALTAMGRHADAAESLYAASLRGQPTAEILYRLAEAELLSGRTEAAEANARQALALNPQHVSCNQLMERLSQARQPRTAARPN
jgi:tetratricopeptide (TPR) repeat protein